MKTHRSASRPQGAKTSLRRRIFLVEDHSVTREGLVLMIDQEPDLVVCGEADSPSLAIKRIFGTVAPDLVVVDVMLRDASGIELLKNLKILMPALPTLALSMHEEGLHAKRALLAGARGFVMKHEPVEVILGAIRRALAGELHPGEQMKARRPARPPTG